MTGYREIKIPEAAYFIVSKNVLVFDLRDPLSYRCGHMENAINFDKDNLYFLLNNMNKSLPLLFYSDSKIEARNMVDFFSDFGFTQCFYLESGFEEWLQYQDSRSELPKYVRNWLVANGFTGEDVNQRGFNGETPLMVAARNGYVEYLVELIFRGAALDLRNNDGNSAVWLACYSNNAYVLLALIQAGADINIQNDNGANPLIYSASAGRLEMVQLLLQAGANIGLTTLDGFSALDVAATLSILKLLRHVDQGGVLEGETLQYLKAS
jgi:thiosulfate/3-mercaptopyruvate sulfurtransferase